MSNPTHHPECWRDHHECAVREVERLREALEQCLAVLADPRVGTYLQDSPDWYKAKNAAIKVANAALTTKDTPHA